MATSYFITGIGTAIGKTFTSAVLMQYFQADYWKPIQSGDLDFSDSMAVASLVDPHLIFHPERYKLQLAASPHKSAAKEQINIKLEDFQLPETSNRLLVEGAGGLFVPISQDLFMIDLIQKLQLPVILVTKNYLGCINHTILSIQALLQRQIKIAYLVFNGNFDMDTQQILTRHLPEGVEIIQLPFCEALNPSTVKEITKTLNIK